MNPRQQREAPPTAIDIPSTVPSVDDALTAAGYLDNPDARSECDFVGGTVVERPESVVGPSSL